jgi:hypothetical protein
VKQAITVYTVILMRNCKNGKLLLVILCRLCNWCSRAVCVIKANQIHYLKSFIIMMSRLKIPLLAAACSRPTPPLLCSYKKKDTLRYPFFVTGGGEGSRTCIISVYNEKTRIYFLIFLLISMLKYLFSLLFRLLFDFSIT